jgi:hypothetical protein
VRKLIARCNASGIGATARLVLAVGLVPHEDESGVAFPCLDSIEQSTGLGRSTIIRDIGTAEETPGPRTLIGAGIVRAEKRRKGRGWHNVYTIVDTQNDPNPDVAARDATGSTVHVVDSAPHGESTTCTLETTVDSARGGQCTTWTVQDVGVDSAPPALKVSREVPKEEQNPLPPNETGRHRDAIETLVETPTGATPPIPGLDVAPTIATTPARPKRERKAPPTAAPDVLAVWEHWRKVMASPHSVLDPGRCKRIEWGVATYGAETCKRAIDGYARSDFHMGRDPKTDGKKHNDPTLIFRDATHVEKFLAPAAKHHDAVPRYVPPAEIEDRVPPDEIAAKRREAEQIAQAAHEDRHRAFLQRRFGRPAEAAKRGVG